MDLEKFKELHKISTVIEVTDIKNVQTFMDAGLLLLAVNPSGEDCHPPFTYCLGWPKGSPCPDIIKAYVPVQL